MHQGAHQRQFQQPGVHPVTQGRGCPEGVAYAEGHRDQRDKDHPPPGLHELREANDHHGEGRQFGAKAFEHRFELRHDIDQQDPGDNRRDEHHHQRVGHGFPDPGLEAFAFFLVGRDPLQKGVEGTGLLAGIHQVAIQLIEIPGLLAQGGGETAACRNFLFQFVHQLAHGRIVEALADDVEGLQQRHAGLHHRRHLPGEQGNVLGLDTLAHAENRMVFFANLARTDALLAQFRLDQRRVLSAEFAGHFCAFAVDAFPRIHADFRCLDRHVQSWVFRLNCSYSLVKGWGQTRKGDVTKNVR
ncbi:hypothetical protein D9M71_347010 [compost metagenome]